MAIYDGPLPCEALIQWRQRELQGAAPFSIRPQEAGSFLEHASPSCEPLGGVAEEISMAAAALRARATLDPRLVGAFRAHYALVFDMSHRQAAREVQQDLMKAVRGFSRGEGSPQWRKEFKVVNTQDDLPQGVAPETQQRVQARPTLYDSQQQDNTTPLAFAVISLAGIREIHKWQGVPQDQGQHPPPRPQSNYQEWRLRARQASGRGGRDETESGSETETETQLVYEPYHSPDWWHLEAPPRPPRPISVTKRLPKILPIPSYITKDLMDRSRETWRGPGHYRRVRDEIKFVGKVPSDFNGLTQSWANIQENEKVSAAIKDTHRDILCRRDTPGNLVAPLLLQNWVGFRAGPSRSPARKVWEAPAPLKSFSKPLLELVHKSLHPNGVRNPGGTLARPQGPRVPVPPEPPDPINNTNINQQVPAPEEGGVVELADQRGQQQMDPTGEIVPPFNSFTGPAAADTPPRGTLFGALGTIRGLLRVYAKAAAKSRMASTSFLDARSAAIRSLRAGMDRAPETE